MPELVHIDVQPSKPAVARSPHPRAIVLWLQGVTLAWMLVEFGVSAYAALTAHSPAMLAFGSALCARLRGGDDCYWVNGSAVAA